MLKGYCKQRVISIKAQKITEKIGMTFSFGMANIVLIIAFFCVFGHSKLEESNEQKTDSSGLTDS